MNRISPIHRRVDDGVKERMYVMRWSYMKQNYIKDKNRSSSLSELNLTEGDIKHMIDQIRKCPHYSISLFSLKTIIILVLWCVVFACILDMRYKYSDIHVYRVIVSVMIWILLCFAVLYIVYIVYQMILSDKNRYRNIQQIIQSLDAIYFHPKHIKCDMLHNGKYICLSFYHNTIDIHHTLGNIVDFNDNKLQVESMNNIISQHNTMKTPAHSSDASTVDLHNKIPDNNNNNIKKLSLFQRKQTKQLTIPPLTHNIHADSNNIVDDHNE